MNSWISAFVISRDGTLSDQRLGDGLAVAVIFWLLRQLAVVYIPGVSALALAGAMLLLASGMDRSRSGQKAAVTLIFAFGLLNILFAIIELYGYFRA